MSDFLSNLAARSLNPDSNLIRPRQASRFEPINPGLSVSTGFDADTNDSFDVMDTQVEAPHPRLEQPELNPSRMQQIKANPNPSSQLDGQNWEQISPIETLPHLTTSLQPQASRDISIPAARIEPINQDVPSAPVRREATPLHPKAHPNQEAPIPREIGASQDISVPTRVEPITQNLPLTPVQREAPLSPPHEEEGKVMRDSQGILPIGVKRETVSLAPSEDEITRLIRKHAPSARSDSGGGVGNVIRPVAAEDREMRPVLSLNLPIAPQVTVNRPQSPAEPLLSTINVTIGRIEVRATQPTPVARTPKESPRPGAELEDYLRKRGGGRNSE
jgi:hypothetical protein